MVCTLTDASGRFIGYGMEPAVRSLQDLVCEGAQPDAHVHAAAAQLASALQHTHAKRVVHGDVKPDNVLVRAQRPMFQASALSQPIVLQSTTVITQRMVRGTCRTGSVLVWAQTTTCHFYWFLHCSSSKP